MRLRWHGMEHSVQTREGFPPCPPLRSTFSLVSSSRPSPSHWKRRVSAGPRMSLVHLQSVRCLLPASFLHRLPSLLGLSPSPLAPFPQLTARAGLPPPCENLALNLPPPQVTPIRLLPRSVYKRSFLLHAARSLLNSQ